MEVYNQSQWSQLAELHAAAGDFDDANAQQFQLDFFELRWRTNSTAMLCIRLDYLLFRMNPATHLLSRIQWEDLCTRINDEDFFDPPTWHITLGRVKIRTNQGGDLEAILTNLLSNDDVTAALQAALSEIAVSGYFKQPNGYVFLQFEENTLERLQTLQNVIQDVLDGGSHFRRFIWDTPNTNIARTYNAVESVNFPESNRIQVTSGSNAIGDPVILSQMLCFKIQGFMKDNNSGHGRWESYRSLSL